VEVLQELLARVEESQGTINAFTRLHKAEARLAAEAAEGRWRRGEALGALDGVPVSIKDHLGVRGWPATFGSALLRETPSDEDEPAVAKLRAGGAVFYGQTTMPDFGAAFSSISSLSGVTRNPRDLALTTGGSSAGAAAAAGAGLGPLHLGSDGYGSIRGPAAWCGVFGFKARAATAMGSAVGPITPTLADLLAYHAAIGVKQSAVLPKRLGWLAYPSEDGVRPASTIEAAALTAAERLAARLGAELIVLPALFRAGEHMDMFVGFFPEIARRFDGYAAADLSRLEPNLLSLAGRAKLVPKEEAAERQARYLAAVHRVGEVLSAHRLDAVISPSVAQSPFQADRYYAADYDPFRTPLGLDDGSHLLHAVGMFNNLNWVAASVPYPGVGSLAGVQVAVAPSAHDVSTCLRLLQLLALAPS
jgi:Asp-tRNA(Asn)/Glu-tRNA(Gln) amidotransferase A subunit family amidase